MPDTGFTVTPSIITDANGQEQVSYEHADVSSTSGRSRAIEQFQYEQENYITENSKGERQHAYDYGSVPDDYLYEPPTPTTEGVKLPDTDVAYVMEQVGGEEQFNEMMSWSKANLPKDLIRSFNDIVNTSDMEQILDATKTLSNLYHQHAGQSLQQDEPQQRAFVEAEFFPTDEEVETQEQFAQAMYAKIGGEENFRTLLGWAEKNLTTTSIDIFDNLMNGNDYHAKEQAIDMLIKSFRDQAEED